MRKIAELPEKQRRPGRPGRRGKRRKAEKQGKPGEILAAGMMTVEAAVLIPLLFLMSVMLLICLFYRHNLNYYTAAAAETALRGNAAEEGGEDLPLQQAEITAAERRADQPAPGSPPQAEVFCGEGGSGASFSGQRFPVFSDFFRWETGMTVQRVHPAGELRREWRRGQTWDGIP